MPDVIDFLVLRQNYDIAMQRNWKKGKYKHIFIVLHCRKTNLCFNFDLLLQHEILIIVQVGVLFYIFSP
jgi:hypothetical protein